MLILGIYGIRKPADGISAVDACCVCGGGKKSEGNEEKQKAIGKSYSWLYDMYGLVYFVELLI